MALNNPFSRTLGADPNELPPEFKVIETALHASPKAGSKIAKRALEGFGIGNASPDLLRQIPNTDGKPSRILHDILMEGPDTDAS